MHISQEFHKIVNFTVNDDLINCFISSSIQVVVSIEAQVSVWRRILRLYFVSNFIRSFKSLKWLCTPAHFEAAMIWHGKNSTGWSRPQSLVITHTNMCFFYRRIKRIGNIRPWNVIFQHHHWSLWSINRVVLLVSDVWKIQCLSCLVTGCHNGIGHLQAVTWFTLVHTL